MAKVLKIESLYQAPEGYTEITYKYGNDLATTNTSTIRFMSKEDILNQLLDMNQSMPDQYMLLLLLSMTYVNTNGTLKNDQAILGKALYFDVMAANPLRVA